MSTKAKAFITVIGVLLVVTVISLIIISRGPLYGKAAEDNWVPDMTGRWAISEGAGYNFEDVTDPDCPPVYTESSLPDPGADEGYLYITDQIGRVFAGTWNITYDPDIVAHKLTGVILPDRTVSMQAFETSEYRIFITGRMTKSGGTLQISGYAHQFSDFGADNGDKTMSSGYGIFIKID